MTSLFENLISSDNIYKAIYSLESYVFEKELLNNESIDLYNKLADKYNQVEINKVISKCKKELTKIINEDNTFFDIQIYYKPKKIEDSKEVFRPMHTADLITQICLVSMLNLIMFDDSDGTRKLADICKLIPSNFYGNIPSTNVHSVFKHWSSQYADYSTRIISANKEYNENKKYKQEVNLDLISFFPSIDPAYIYSFIWDNISSFYTKENKKILKKILIKLLYFNVILPEGSKDIDEYYKDINGSIKPIKKQKNYFNLGLPQGLPQAYLFGNFCMIEVAKIIEKKISGDAFYYVDDSVIFANVEEHQFQKLVEEINKNLSEQIKGEHKKIKLSDSLNQFYEQIGDHYEVSIHEYKVGLKTSISDISFQNYLWELARPASTTTFQLKATFNDLEDETLKRKLEALIKYIDKKLDEINNEEEDQKKLLERYRKFYLYRLKVLNYRIDNNISEDIIQKFASDYGLNPNNKINFFKRLEDDIFIREAQMLLKYLVADVEKHDRIIKLIQDFENSLESKFTNHYFSKMLIQYKKILLDNNNEYITIEEKARRTVPPFLKSNSKDSKNKIIEIIHSKNLPTLLNIYKEGYFSFIFNNSSEFQRRIYNALFSYILSIPINDNFNLIKINGRAIHYYELRLLVYLRLNYQFDDKEFFQFADQLIQNAEDNEEKVDLTLFEVLPILKKYVGKPKHIDDLILTHRFVNGIWKNGSKFLHFYTLHNVEHSVELIKYCTQITKSIDYLTVKNFDYYILFMACYLHDIAMVIYPNLDNFGKKNDLESELQITKWKEDFQEKFKKPIKKENNTDIAKFILQSFHIINDYFEKTIRENHPHNSANFIIKQNDLHFIQELTREIIAEISEGHGYEMKDVYGIKSKAKDKIVSKKYLMILLRLADLMDMSKDRVSINILKQNIKHMPEESKFQWISHMAIDKCTIESDFKIQEIKNHMEQINAEAKILEEVIFKIYLNTRIMTSVKIDGCKNIKCDISAKKDSIDILIDPEEDSSCSGCNFISKWMVKKNQYLFNELQSLQKYLERNSKNTVFSTTFKVKLDMKNTNRLSAEFIDVVDKKINA